MNDASAAVDERPRAEPVLVYAATPGRGLVRTLVLVLLGAAPLALGSVYPSAYVPLLLTAFALGGYSLHRANRLRLSGVTLPEVPALRPLGLLLGLVAFQLLPLPPLLLSRLSPGSYHFYSDELLLPLREWRPITASPPDTARGLTFLLGMTLLYVCVYREFDHPAWRRRLAKTIVFAGFLMTMEALVQQAYAANVIYGIYHPRWDWAVFGPYVNRNLFAGYMLMAVPLAAGLVAESMDDLRRAWRRRRRGWLALGDPEASAFFRWAAVAMVLVVGLLATHSRGAVLGFVVWAVAVPLVSRARRRAAVLVLAVAALGLVWVGIDSHVQTFLARGFQDTPRFLIWADSLRLIPLHPLFGSGFNAFGSAFPPRQHVFTTEWIGATHNDYLQALVDLGLVGFGVVVVLVVRLVRQARRSAAQSAFHAGVFGSLVAVLAHNLVDYNWQLAANAATFVALAALAMQPVLSPPRDERERGRGRDRHRRVS